MKYFLFFLLLSFFAGTVLWRLDRKKRNLGLLLVCLGLSFAYFFLYKI